MSIPEAKVNSGEVHLWIASTEVSSSLLQEFECTLDEDERRRAGAFYFDQHRSRYIAAHGILRDILRRYLAEGGCEISFAKTAFGKPYLRQNGRSAVLSFNMSHSGDLVVVALAQNEQIGVDVELIRPVPDLESIAQTNFAPSERALLADAADLAARERIFFQCWTRKEAYIKALGSGLAISLPSFEAVIPPGCSGSRLQSTDGPPDGKTWWLSDLIMPQGYSGALVVEKGYNELTYHNWRS